MFSIQSVSENPLTAKFQLSSAASLNLGWSQNGVLGNGLCINLTLKFEDKCSIMLSFRSTIPGNFSFSHDVSHSYISLVHQSAALYGNGLNNLRILHII